VVEQQHDRAPDRGEALVAVGAGELLAGLSGEQAPLACVDHGAGGGGIWPTADAPHELPCAHQHRGQARDPVAGDVAAGVRGELEPVQRHALDRALGIRGRHGGDVEQGGGGQQGGNEVGHFRLAPLLRRAHGRGGGRRVRC
jgi:hypothetical protein